MENVTNLTHKPLPLGNGIVLSAYETRTIELPSNTRITQLLRMNLIKVASTHEGVTTFPVEGETSQSSADARKAAVLARRQSMLNAETKETTKATKKGSSSTSKGK